MLHSKIKTQLTWLCFFFFEITFANHQTEPFHKQWNSHALRYFRINASVLFFFFFLGFVVHFSSKFQIFSVELKLKWKTGSYPILKTQYWSHELQMTRRRTFCVLTRANKSLRLKYKLDLFHRSSFFFQI
jgi:hypothetical protein